MSILIKGMEMPKYGHINVRIYADGAVCEPTTCPIVWRNVGNAAPVPPHGRLIDADELLNDVRKHSESYFADDFAHEWVDVAPTVIEAEDGKT